MATISKRTLDDGQTRYVVDYYDLQGKRRKERYKKEREARARLAEVLSHKDTGELRARADDIKFRNLVDDWKLAHWPEIRPNSQAAYGNLLDAHILPLLGERKLRTITLKDAEDLQHRVVQAVMASAAANNRYAKGGRVSANLALTVLRVILGYAERHGYVTRNVARHAKMRPVPAEEQQERDDHELLTPDELRRLFAAADGVWRPFLMTAALTGLRRGELLGLTWGDVDWNSGRVHVRRQMQNGAFAPVKSAAGRRSVTMPPELVLELKKWRLACPKGERDLVFPNGSGSALFESNVYSQGLRPALRRAGLRQMKLHDLRHGFGSMLVSAGVSIKAVQVAMGHANVMMTLQVYTHLMPGDDAAVARTISSSVFGPGAGGNLLGTSSEKGPESRAVVGTST